MNEFDHRCRLAWPLHGFFIELALKLYLICTSFQRARAMSVLGKRCIIIFALLVELFPLYAAHAQTQKDVQYVKGSLSGHEFQVTYREGGPLYGTYFFLDVHFCSSGRYMLYGQSRKQTVLGNEQVNNWNDSGRWDVVPHKGHASLQYVSASGARDIVPLEILPDGRIRPLSGAFMQRRGNAQCR